jgi:hypothetical protein
VPEEVTVGIENIDEAKPSSRNVIVFSVSLLGISHKNFAVEISDAERRVACRKTWVGKVTMLLLLDVMNNLSPRAILKK